MECMPEISRCHSAYSVGYMAKLAAATAYDSTYGLSGIRMKQLEYTLYTNLSCVFFNIWGTYVKQKFQTFLRNFVVRNGREPVYITVYK